MSNASSPIYGSFTELGLSNVVMPGSIKAADCALGAVAGAKNLSRISVKRNQRRFPADFMF